jgi:hypothetical protein
VDKHSEGLENGTAADQEVGGKDREPEFPRLSHRIGSGRRRPWPVIGIVVVVLLVAVTIVGVTFGGSRKSSGHPDHPAAVTSPDPPPGRVVLTAQGLVARTPDIRGAVESAMPPEMRSALDGPSMQRSLTSWVGSSPYGEQNWSYTWSLNGDTDFHLDPTAVTHSRGLYAIVSTFNTVQEAAQGFGVYEKGAHYISSIRSVASCDIDSNRCHYYGARPAMGDGSFDLDLDGSILIIEHQRDTGQLKEAGVLVGARFRNVTVYVYWYGIDIPRGDYPGGDINKGTVLPYSAALPQGISYVKAILGNL